MFWIITILFVAVLVIGAWSMRSDSRMRKEVQRAFGEDCPAEIQKTSSFGALFFWAAAGVLIVGVLYLVGGNFLIAGVLVLIAFVLWYIGFRIDRPRMKEYYSRKAEPHKD